MRLRVVSWNLDSRATGFLDAKIELLRSLAPDLALLQELNRSVYRGLLPHPSAYQRIYQQPTLFSWGALSTNLCRPRGSEVRLGCAVLGTTSTAMLTARLLEDAPFAVDEPRRTAFLQRTVAVTVAIPGGRSLLAGSFHARPVGEQAYLAPNFHAGVAGWLAGTTGPVVFGMDANAPAVDHPDFRRSVFDRPTPPDGGPGEDQLLGPDAGHGLRDVLRLHLDRHPDQLAYLRDRTPNGPLAVSGIRSGVPVRHDHIWARDLALTDARYHYEEAVAAGSDHAVVVADFEV